MNFVTSRQGYRDLFSISGRVFHKCFFILFQVQNLPMVHTLFFVRMLIMMHVTMYGNLSVISLSPREKFCPEILPDTSHETSGGTIVAFHLHAPR